MKKALICGINPYSSSPLRGCVNDVLLTHRITNTFFGFKGCDTVVLTDKECTKKNILFQLQKLVFGVKPGDTILFHYSGHGSQVAVSDWTNNDEVDGMDEILCPIDLDWNDPLRDHELGRIFNTLPKGVKTTVVLDCCHSGTGLRGNNITVTDDGDEYQNRFLAPPISNLLSNPNITVGEDLTFLLPKESKNLKTPFMIDTLNQGDVILISGCQDNQTSADARIDGRWQGALTYYLSQVLLQANFKISYRDLIDRINKALDKTPYTQNPQLEGDPRLFDTLYLS